MVISKYRNNLVYFWLMTLQRCYTWNFGKRTHLVSNRIGGTAQELKILKARTERRNRTELNWPMGEFSSVQFSYVAVYTP